MDEICSNLSDQTKFRLNEINKIKDYLNSEIQERKTMSKKLSKCIAAFDYIFYLQKLEEYVLFLLQVLLDLLQEWQMQVLPLHFLNRNNKKIIKHNKK